MGQQQDNVQQLDSLPTRKFQSPIFRSSEEAVAAREHEFDMRGPLICASGVFPFVPFFGPDLIVERFRIVPHLPGIHHGPSRDSVFPCPTCRVVCLPSVDDDFDRRLVAVSGYNSMPGFRAAILDVQNQNTLLTIQSSPAGARSPVWGLEHIPASSSYSTSSSLLATACHATNRVSLHNCDTGRLHFETDPANVPLDGPNRLLYLSKKATQTVLIVASNSPPLPLLSLDLETGLTIISQLRSESRTDAVHAICQMGSSDHNRLLFLAASASHQFSIFDAADLRRPVQSARASGSSSAIRSVLGVGEHHALLGRRNGTVWVVDLRKMGVDSVVVPLAKFRISRGAIWDMDIVTQQEEEKGGGGSSNRRVEIVAGGLANELTVFSMSQGKILRRVGLPAGSTGVQYLEGLPEHVDEGELHFTLTDRVVFAWEIGEGASLGGVVRLKFVDGVNGSSSVDHLLLLSLRKWMLVNVGV